MHRITSKYSRSISFSFLPSRCRWDELSIFGAEGEKKHIATFDPACRELGCTMHIFCWHPCVLSFYILQPPFWGTLTLWKYIRRQKLDVWVGIEWSSCFRKLGADTRGLVDTIISYSSHLKMDGWKTSLFLSFSNRPSWQVRSAKC